TNTVNMEHYFKLPHSFPEITQEEFEKNKCIVDAVKEISQNFNQGLYLFDHLKGDFLQVFPKLYELCGENTNGIQEIHYETYLQHIPEEERQILLEINERSRELFRTLPIEKRKSSILSYNLHLVCNGKKTLVNHKLRPIMLTPNGNVWIALCTMQLPARKGPGHAIIQHADNHTYDEYDMQGHEWIRRRTPTLNELERDILILSARGHTMTEIAAEVHKSVNTIKTCKWNLFKRLDVKSITEALTYAINNNLI
ncbi:MAG: LuxR C-terminal-related transcriptional regulator, partial [Paraprevotella sp.]|nr:LuxR C-terminal-related transcriptional regulator [Paraprevotella sp.]